MPKHLTAREILERLVAFPTVSSDSNLALVDWVANYLSELGIRSVREVSADGRRASIAAHIGPEAAGGVILSGHTDVVPVEGQNWTSDPWQLTERDGRLYGRGTCDMKGFDALALAAVPLALERGIRRPLQIALTRDEEIGCLGAPPLIEVMQREMPRASVAIIGEPSRMQVVTAHKAGGGFEVTVRGHEVHSSRPHEGESAVMRAAGLIDWANRQNAAAAAQPPSEVAALFEPPWSHYHTGTIHGGTAYNITAGLCRFDIDVRAVPDDDMNAWLERFRAEAGRVAAEMRRTHPDAGIEMEPYFSMPGLAPERDGAAERLTRHLTGDNGTHVVSYGTEAGQFQQAGYSAVICGPGDIEQAHQADEYLECAQLAAGEAFMARLIDHLAE